MIWPRTRAATDRQEREMTQGEADAFREGFRRGAEAMAYAALTSCDTPVKSAGGNSMIRERMADRILKAFLALPLPAPEDTA
jgi:hypothetical protein